jgi:hypothetical protein
MTTTIEFLGEGIPLPYIHTLISYDLPSAFGHEGHIRFLGHYRILEKMKFIDLELETYEAKFNLPQILTMVVNSSEVESHTYIIAIYKRLIKHTEYNVDSEEGVEQTLFFTILKTI